jgi:hypothetical protein
MTDYTIDNKLSDVVIVCSDEVKLYYSRWNLGANCIGLRPALEDRESKEIPINDYDSKTVSFVLQYIDDGTDTTKTNDDLLKVYEFTYQYDFKKMEAVMEHQMECNSSIHVLESLEKRKSKSYTATLQHFMKNKKNSELYKDIEIVPRFMLDDVCSEYRKQFEIMDKQYEIMDTIINKFNSSSYPIANAKLYQMNPQDKQLIDSLIVDLKSIPKKIPVL